MADETSLAIWKRWRRQRYQRLFANGMSADLAWSVASAEAKYRQKISRVIGDTAARAAELISYGDGFALRGSSASLSEGQVQAIRMMNFRAMPLPA